MEGFGRAGQSQTRLVNGSKQKENRDIQSKKYPGGGVFRVRTLRNKKVSYPQTGVWIHHRK